MSKRNRGISAGIALDKGEAGSPPGMIMSELMLGIGYNGFLVQKRKQLTRSMLRSAGRIIFLMSEKETREYLPKGLDLSGVKIDYWDIGTAQMSVYKAFPPPTYNYHIGWVVKINERVGKLVKEIG